MINKELLNKMIEEKLVFMQKHPDADLFIYNYSPQVQYEKLWNEVTKMTRGLILDKEMNIVARPFSKFFNYEEHKPEEIPTESFEVYEKMDGSLGILYWLNDKPYIATRGSFTSDQAIHATKVLYDKYSHLFDRLKKDCTYLFEIIYPSNRIVVDYKGMDDLVLLSIVDNSTGKEWLEDIGFPVVKKYDNFKDVAEIKSLMTGESDDEGFVVKFKSGFRMKLKYVEYCRLHRILTGVSNIAVWEYLRDNKQFDELLDRVPDEFFSWLKNTRNDLQTKFDTIKTEVEVTFKELVIKKEYAEKAKKEKYPALLFTRLDSYSSKYDRQIWEMIRPEFSKPFKTEKE